MTKIEAVGIGSDKGENKIDELIKKKKRLENDIDSLITRFHEETGLVVDAVVIEEVDYWVGYSDEEYSHDIAREVAVTAILP